MKDSDLIDCLRKVDIEPMREQFVDDAFLKVRRHAVKRASRYTRPLLALAASFLLVGALVIFSPVVQRDKPSDMLAIAPFFGVDNRPHNLRIAFNSPSTVDNIGVEIILPESLNFVGSELRRLRWQTKLYKGKNELRLPLKSLRISNDSSQEEVVMARLTHGKQVKEFRVRLIRSAEV